MANISLAVLIPVMKQNDVRIQRPRGSRGMKEDDLRSGGQ